METLSTKITNIVQAYLAGEIKELPPYITDKRLEEEMQYRDTLLNAEAQAEQDRRADEMFDTAIANFKRRDEENDTNRAN